MDDGVEAGSSPLSPPPSPTRPRRRLSLNRSARGVQAHQLELDHEGHERTEVASKSVLYRIMSALLPTQVMWGWVTSQKGRGKRGDEVLTEELVKERRRRLFRSLSRSLRSDEFLLLFNLLDKDKNKLISPTEFGHLLYAIFGYSYKKARKDSASVSLTLLLNALYSKWHQEDGYDPTKCSMSMERFRQFYDAIRLERRGVHPRLVGDLFDYVDFTVGLNGEHHLHPMGTSRTEHSSNAFDVLLAPLVLYTLMPVLYIPYTYFSQRGRVRRVAKWQGRVLRCCEWPLLARAALEWLLVVCPLWGGSFAPLLLWVLGRTSSAVSTYEIVLPAVGLVCCGIVRHAIAVLADLSKSRWVKLRKEKQRIEPLKVQMWFFHPNGEARSEQIPMWSIMRGSFSVYKGIGPGHLHVSAVPSPRHTLTSHASYLLWGVVHSAAPFLYRWLNSIDLQNRDIVVAVLFSLSSIILGFSLLTMMSQLALEFWSYYASIIRIGVVTDPAQAMKAGFPCVMDLNDASTLLRWLQLRAYVLARKTAPIEAPKPLFVFMLVAFLLLAAMIGAEILFFKVSVSSLDIIMQLLLFVLIFCVLLYLLILGTTANAEQALHHTILLKNKSDVILRPDMHRYQALSKRQQDHLFGQDSTYNLQNGATKQRRSNPTGADGEISLEDEVDMAELLSLAMEILKERDRPLKVLGVELDNTLLVTVLSLFGTLGGAVISGLMRFLL